MSLDTVLNGLPDFERLSDRDRAALSAALEQRHYKDGERFIQQGKRGDGAHFLVSGAVRVELERGDERIDLGMVAEGELFGVIAMIDHRPRSASCTAVGKVETAFLSRQAFEMLAHRHASIAYPFQRAVGTQVAADFRDVVDRIRGRINA